MNDSQEYSKGGSQILRYAEREGEIEFADQSDSSIEEIGEHIERWIGDVETVYHEIISPTVHVDVHFVSPGPGRDFATLVTSGMSDKPMKTDFEGLEYAELVACLPPDWPLTEEAFKDEANYWPVRWLKMLARFAHEYNTWIWQQHTIPNGDPAVPYADNTGFVGMLLGPPIMFDDGFAQLKVRDDKVIHFHSLIPLYAEEMQYKLDRGTEALFEKFDRAGYSGVIDINRPNLCERPEGFLGRLKGRLFG